MPNTRTQLAAVWPPTAEASREPGHAPTSPLNVATVALLPPRNDHAAASTVEALMYSLRARGAAALSEHACRDRLASLSSDQVRGVIACLIEMRPHYSSITDELLFKLADQL